MRHCPLHSIVGATVDTTSSQHVSAYGSASAADGYGAPRKRPLGIALGIAVSLLLHALLIYGYRTRHGSTVVDDAKRIEPLTVWIRPLATPTPPAAPQTAAIAPPKPAPAYRPARKPAQPAPLATTPRPSDNVVTPAAAPPNDAPHVIVNADQFAPPQPHFDMEAARRTARAVASTPDPERARTAVGQIPERPLATETKLARDMAQAKRGDCKDGLPGGLLAPVFLLMEKKGTGCKW